MNRLIAIVAGTLTQWGHELDISMPSIITDRVKINCVLTTHITLGPHAVVKQDVSW